MRLFVDTSAWLALNNKGDQYHSKALSRSTIIKKQNIDLLTSDYILDESITVIYRASHRAAVVFGDALMSSAIVTVIDVTDEDRFNAWAMFKKYGDKELSFLRTAQVSC
jgi:predicted nucleic acid-binding protein